jgi:hypothetical protein
MHPEEIPTRVRKPKPAASRHSIREDAGAEADVRLPERVSISEIVREAYTKFARDRDSRKAVKLCLGDQGGSAGRKPTP